MNNKNILISRFIVFALFRVILESLLLGNKITSYKVIIRSIVYAMAAVAMKYIIIFLEKFENNSK